MDRELLEVGIKILDSLINNPSTPFYLGEESPDGQWEAAEYLQSRNLITDIAKGVYKITGKGRKAKKDFWLEQELIVAEIHENGFRATHKDDPLSRVLLSLDSKGFVYQFKPYQYRLTAKGEDLYEADSIEAYKERELQQNGGHGIYITGSQVGDIQQAGQSASKYTAIEGGRGEEKSSSKTTWATIGGALFTIIMMVWDHNYEKVWEWLTGLFK